MDQAERAGPAEPRQHPVEGVLWMLAATVCAVIVTSLIRLVGEGVPAAQSSFLRFTFGSLLMLPVLLPLFRRGLPQGAFRLFALRGVLHTAAALLTYVAIVRIPLAEVTAIGYLMPVLVAVGAVVFYGERLLQRRVIAIALALVGAFVILRPGLREIGIGQLAQLASAVFAAGSYLLVKRLIGLVNPAEVVALLMLGVAILMAPLALAVWGPVTPAELGLIALTGAAATLGHYCFTRSFKAAPVSVVQPVIFLQLVWSVALGTLAFGDPVDPFVILGGLVIVTAISLLAWQESSKARHGAAAPTPGV